MDKFSLAGKTAAVTGGLSGLGQAIALSLAEAGANVVLVDLREPEDNTALAAIEKLGSRALFVKTDVTREQQVINFVDKTVREFGSIDILVTAAGVGNKTPAEELTEAEWNKVMDTNLRGLFLCCQKAGIKMIAQKSGSIVNISSMSGFMVNKDRTILAYCASKSAVSMLTKNLAVEWAKHNIRVNAIAPGYFVTPFNSIWMNNPQATELALDLTPMKRFGQPHEIGSAAVFLASPAASFITGHTLVIDGGYTCW